MKQQKLLVCLLSTSLLIPSFSINDVSAESLEKSATTSESNDVYKEKMRSKLSNHIHQKMEMMKRIKLVMKRKIVNARVS